MTFKWPSFLVSTEVSLSLHTPTKEVVLATEGFPFYGITWDKGNIYYTRGTGRSPHNRDQVVVLDKTYREVGTLPGVFPEAHQIHFDGDRLLVTVTHRDSLASINLDTKQEQFYNWTGVGTDENHINCVWPDTDGIWVGYHSYAADPEPPPLSSRLVLMDEQFSTIKKTIDIGLGSHNVARIDDLLYICSSNENKLLVYSLSKGGVVQEVPNLRWVRGMAITDKYIVLGASVVQEDRSKRHLGDGKVFLLDRDSLDILDTKVLSDSGPLYELRVVGTTDYAHNGVPFPGDLRGF